jgi:transposase
VSLKQTSVCVVNQVGSVVREGVVDSEPEAIAAFACNIDPPASSYAIMRGGGRPLPRREQWARQG